MSFIPKTSLGKLGLGAAALTVLGAGVYAGMKSKSKDAPYPELRERSEVFIFDKRNNEVLAGKEPFGTCFAGGGIDKGESPRDGAIREVLEEVGLRVNPRPVPIEPSEIFIKPQNRINKTHFFFSDVGVPDKSVYGADNDTMEVIRQKPKDILQELHRKMEDESNHWRDEDSIRYRALKAALKMNGMKIASPNRSFKESHKEGILNGMQAARDYFEKIGFIVQDPEEFQSKTANYNEAYMYNRPAHASYSQMYKPSYHPMGGHSYAQRPGFDMEQPLQEQQQRYYRPNRSGGQRAHVQRLLGNEDARWEDYEYSTENQFAGAPTKSLATNAAQLGSVGIMGLGVKKIYDAGVQSQALRDAISPETGNMFSKLTSKHEGYSALNNRYEDTKRLMHNAWGKTVQDQAKNPVAAGSPWQRLKSVFSTGDAVNEDFANRFSENAKKMMHREELSPRMQRRLDRMSASGAAPKDLSQANKITDASAATRRAARTDSRAARIAARQQAMANLPEGAQAPVTRKITIESARDSFKPQHQFDSRSRGATRLARRTARLESAGQPTARAAQRAAQRAARAAATQQAIKSYLGSANAMRSAGRLGVIGLGAYGLSRMFG